MIRLRSNVILPKRRLVFDDDGTINTWFIKKDRTIYNEDHYSRYTRPQTSKADGQLSFDASEDTTSWWYTVKNAMNCYESTVQIVTMGNRKQK